MIENINAFDPRTETGKCFAGIKSQRAIPPVQSYRWGNGGKSALYQVRWNAQIVAFAFKAFVLERQPAPRCSIAHGKTDYPQDFLDGHMHLFTAGIVKHRNMNPSRRARRDNFARPDFPL
jgi:hypothetical protein